MEAKHPGFIPDFLKQKSDPERYNGCLYNSLEELHVQSLKDRTICEMGPGQFLTHPFLVYQLGAKSSYLLEIADFAHQDRKAEANGHIVLRKDWEMVRRLPRPKETDTWKDYLKTINAEYFTCGLDGYKKVPDNSVDYVFSYAVIEHIRKNIFVETISEMYRMMKTRGVSYHTVDLRDHFGGSKNQLRFAESEWEDEVHYRMDNYTNRLSCSEICSICESCGFRITSLEREYYEKPPVKRKNLDRAFQSITDEDLMTKGFVMVLEKQPVCNRCGNS